MLHRAIDESQRGDEGLEGHTLTLLSNSPAAIQCPKHIIYPHLFGRLTQLPQISLVQSTPE